MMILYSPQFNLSGQKIFYTFEKDKVIAELDGKVDAFDFNGMPDGKADSIESDTLGFSPVISAERKEGVLHLVLLNFIDFDATEEEKYPEWQEVVFDGKDSLEDS